jgi:hypothetical protein
MNTNVLGPYQIQYSVADLDGNTTVVYRVVEVVDSTEPVIQLIGNATITIEIKSAFTDPGATASDTNEGDLTTSIQVTDNLDVNTLGTYTYTYNVDDSSGNSASPVTRTVVVQDTTPPDFSLIGSEIITLNVNDSFLDPGVSAIDANEGDISGSVSIIGTVNTSIVGNYILYYNISDNEGNSASQLVRTVQVIENTPPVITLTGSDSIVLEVFDTYSDEGATASDNYDGDISGLIVESGIVDPSVLGVTTIRYNVTDSSGNDATEVIRTVTVQDTTPPTITLIGDASILLEVGDNFTDPGVTVNDNYDGSITSGINVTDTVDTNTAGIYFITYDVADSQGNLANQVVRTVVVGAPPTISLQGNNPLLIQYNEPYTELYATAVDSDGNVLTPDITISGTVDSSILGSYNVQYSVTDSSGITTTIQRTVNVVDTTLPVIVLAGNAAENVAVGSEYIDAGVSASDNYDGDITSSINQLGDVDSDNIGLYTLTFNVADSQGNDAITVTRTVEVVDEVTPTISLFGSASITLEVGDSYTS